MKEAVGDGEEGVGGIGAKSVFFFKFSKISDAQSLPRLATVMVFYIVRKEQLVFPKVG